MAADRPLRIAHLLPNLLVGGREAMANALCGEHARLGHTSLLIGYDPPPSGAAVLAPAAPYIQLDRRRGDFTARLSAVLRDHAIDLAHAQGHIPACYLASALAHMPDAPPSLATMHVGLEGTRRWFWQIRNALRAMDGLTAVSHDMARSYSRLAGRPVSLVANGVDCDALGQIAPQWPSAGAPFRFAMLSRLAPIKRHADAVSAAERLIAAGYALELHIAGEGQCREQLTALANTRAWLKLAGHVDPAAFLQGKHGFVLPSRAEGTPLALLEAMAAGLPAIVSDLPSLRDMAGDGASYVPAFERHALAQAMQHLMSDAGHWAQLGRTARRRAQDFDMRVVAAKYQAQYSHLAASLARNQEGQALLRLADATFV